MLATQRLARRSWRVPTVHPLSPAFVELAPLVTMLPEPCRMAEAGSRPQQAAGELQQDIIKLTKGSLTMGTPRMVLTSTTSYRIQYLINATRPTVCWSFLYDDANGIRQTALRDAYVRTHNVPFKYNNSTEQLRRQIIELTSQKPDLL